MIVANNAIKIKPKSAHPTTGLTWGDKPKANLKEIQAFSGSATTILKRLCATLPWAKWLLTAIMIPINYAETLSLALDTHKESAPEDATKRTIKTVSKFVSSLLSSALSIATTVITGAMLLSAVAASPILTVISSGLIIAGAAKSMIDNLCAIGFTLYSRFFGKGNREKHEIAAIKRKIRCYQASTDEREKAALAITESDFARIAELKNKQATRNIKLVNNVHYTLQCAAALVGSALLITPLAPIGLAIILGTAIYGALDAIGVNPLRWIGKKLNALAKSIFGKPLVNINRKVTAENIKMKMGVTLSAPKMETQRSFNIYQKLPKEDLAEKPTPGHFVPMPSLVSQHMATNSARLFDRSSKRKISGCSSTTYESLEPLSKRAKCST